MEENIMNSTERTKALSEIALQIAAELRELEPLRPWTFVEPTEDTYSVYLSNAGDARIYIGFDGYNESTRLTISGHMHIGKNGSYVEVYEKGADGSGWNHVYSPSITVAIKRGPKAVAKDIAKRFLPEYLRVFALAKAKVAEDNAYDTAITANLQHLAKVAGESVPESFSWRREGRKSFTWRLRGNYHTVTASAEDCSLKLDNLTLEQAEQIIRLLKTEKRRHHDRNSKN
jgi:hypothetical protein